MKKIIVALMVIFLSSCTLGKAVTPRQKVSEFLYKYKKLLFALLTSQHILIKYFS